MSEHRPTYRITDMAETDRPRERLAKHGANTLTTPELLAILLRVGVPGENVVQLAQRLLMTFDGLDGLHRAPFEVVCEQRGIGPAKAAQIKAALELGRRFRLDTSNEQASIHSPADAAALVQFDMSVLEQEELWVILLDSRNRVLHIEKVYRGSVNTSQVRIGELFRAAIRRNAAALVVVHNHPSGDPTPSPDDVAVTRAISSAGKLRDFEVLDNEVLGVGGYVSLKERGLGFGG